MFYEKIEFNLEAVHSTGQNCKFYRSIFGFSEVPALCFAEDTIFPYKYFTTNFVIIIYSWIIFTLSIKISLVLPEVSNFVSVSYVGDVEQHISSKYCCAWGGFKYCVVGSRANGPCRIG